MKKKVLALVVLAAMLISILPMAAFAAVTAVRDTSLVSIDDATATADGKESVEVEVYVRDASWAASADPIYVASSRQSVTKFYSDEDLTTLVSAGTGITPDANGKATFYVTSTVAATNYIVVGLNGGATLQDFADAKTDVSAADAKAIADGSGTYRIPLTFTSSSASDIAKYSLATSTSDPTNVLANGSNYYTAKFKVTAANGAPVSGKDVTFNVSGVGATLNKTTATTDANGVAEVKVFATKPDTYYVGAKVGSKEVKAEKDPSTPAGGAQGAGYGFALEFKPISIDTIKATSDDNQKVAKDTDATKIVTFKYAFADAYGNAIKITSADFPGTGNKEFKNKLAAATLVTVTKPSGAKVNNEMKEGTDYNLDVDSEGRLKVELIGSRFDKEGDYEIKLVLANGKSASYKFNVKEQGDVISMTLKYDTESLPAGKDDGATSVAPTVKLLDAEGYAKEVNLSNNKVKFTVDNASLATIGANSGTFKVISDNTGIVTITAIHSDNKMVASATMKIVKAASALKVQSATGAVGETIKVTAQLVDVDGQPVALGTLANNKANAEVVVIGKPDGAVVSSNVTTDKQDDVKKSGKFDFEVVSNKEGEVTVQVILTTNSGLTDASGNAVADKIYTGSGKVTVGKASSVNGNDIVFIIGASSYVVDGKPVAATSVPFIENGRTFLGVRDMGMAMGIIGDENIVWNKATQTAKLVKDGITVEVTVGATAIKVTKNNVTTEVAIDAPAQNKDGRVFLPFRAVFEAFGYSVEYANGSITVTK